MYFGYIQIAIGLTLRHKEFFRIIKCSGRRIVEFLCNIIYAQKEYMRIHNEKNEAPPLANTVLFNLLNIV